MIIRKILKIPSMRNSFAIIFMSKFCLWILEKQYQLITSKVDTITIRTYFLENSYNIVIILLYGKYLYRFLVGPF